ncbi:MAG: tetratricopeptide repeat protein [Myxococcota bacterium]|nr:tetratricopeptide repeat protein [Myxococcota bacterium]
MADGDWIKWTRSVKRWSENAGEGLRSWGERTGQEAQKVGEQTRDWVESFEWKVDPDNVDDSLRELGEKLKTLAGQARYTKVRIKFRGKQLGPEIPMAVFLATEVAAAWWAGPLQALVLTLGAQAVLEIELVHQASAVVQEGVERFLDGEVDAAEALYREALDMKPGDTAALYNLAVLLRVTGRHDEARECFELAADDEDHPDGKRAREALGRMARRESKAETPADGDKPKTL